MQSGRMPDLSKTERVLEDPFVLEVHPGGAIHSGVNEISLSELLDSLAQQGASEEDFIEIQPMQGCTYEDVKPVVDLLIESGFNWISLNDIRKSASPPAEEQG